MNLGNGNKVIGEAYNGSDYQLWRLQKYSDESYSLINKRNPSFRLDNTGQYKDGGHMGIYAINDHPNVRFKIDFLERSRDDNDIIALRMASDPRFVLDAAGNNPKTLFQME